MNTYVWSIQDFDTVPFFAGQSTVVTKVYWQLTATSSDPKPIQAVMCGQTPLNIESLMDFVPFAEITPDIVVGWLTSGASPLVDQSHLKAVLDAQILSQQSALNIAQTVPLKG